MRDFGTAQHEAAHLVVGVALDLKVRSVVIEKARPGWTSGGYCWFFDSAKKTYADALMFAAGVAWENALGHGDPTDAAEDARACRLLVGSAHDYKTCVRAAAAMLTVLAPAHTRLTRALLDRDLTGRDVALLARGERLAD